MAKVSDVVPQLVNVKHASPSALIEKIRQDINEFVAVKELNGEQDERIEEYINILDATLTQFTKDNEHIERREGEVTEADVNLYTGLKKMYSDYLDRLTTIKKDKNMPNEFDDRPIEYMAEELPYQQPTQRREYVEKILNTLEKISGENQQLLLEVISKLCILDSTIGENVDIYTKLMKALGFSEEMISKAFKPDIIKEQYSNSTAVQGVKPSITTSDERKKISFSKYLKKSDNADVNENGKRAYDEILVSDVKKARDVGYAQTANEVDNNEEKTGHSILKNGSNYVRKKTISKLSLRFAQDSQLVKVYGEDLPAQGLQVDPVQLKKILKPFKSGEPRETIHREAFKGRSLPLYFVKDEDFNNSDIVTTKGGPINCETLTPTFMQVNFANFSAALSQDIREPMYVNDAKDLNTSPLIARAFGKNRLLLRKDRGGLLYKNVPDVKKNKYPVRP